jgi:hypothetical protein
MSNTIYYREKYLKYKNKYINLKNQIGSSGGSSSSQPIIQTTSLVLPCEITNYTSKLYISNQSDRDDLSGYLNDLSNKDGVLVGDQIGIVRVNAAFAQDSYIFLKDTSDTNDNTNNHVIPGRSDRGTFVGDEITKHRECNHLLCDGNQLGGNFISSPDNTVFTFDNSDFSNCLNNKLGGDKVVSLNCSFKASCVRHIDETMCFMPYGRGEYKVWIYKFRNITHFDHTNINSILDKYRDDMLDLFYRKKNESHNSLTNKEFIEKVWDLTSWTRTHNTYWKPIYQTALKIALGLLDIELDIDKIKINLEDERLANLDIISTSLFGGCYTVHRNKFVEFPIDLGITIGPHLKKSISDIHVDHKITNIPIFNRLIIETKDVKKCIFSISDKIDQEVETILKDETIKSFIDDDKPFDIHYYNTYSFHCEDSSGCTGGNLHCLVKNQYVAMPKLD